MFCAGLTNCRQRRLPTQIRAGFKISRIRAFYTRKVKYTSETFTERLSKTIEAFPRLQDIHPFHRDLLNTLYDADHFRIALGQLNTAKSLIEAVSRDYVRLLKYGYVDMDQSVMHVLTAGTASRYFNASS